MQGAKTERLRLVSALEVASVVSSILLVVWGLAPLLPRQRALQAIPLLLALGLVVWSQWQRGETLTDLGLTMINFSRAMRLLAWPLLIAGGVMVAIGKVNGSLHLYKNFTTALLLLPLSGIAQQYLLQSFIHRRLRQALGLESDGHQNGEHWRRTLAITLTAAIFSLVHAPNMMLMLLTAIGGIVWSLVFDRASNIIAPGLTHGMMSLLAICTLPPWMLESMAVGYSHFLYRSF